MRLRVSLGIAALAIALGAAAASAQQPQLPVGESKGVRLVRDDQGALVWVFTREADRLYRRVRGKRVSVSCTDAPAEYRLSIAVIGEGTQAERVPRHGRRLRTGDLTPWDYCRLSLPSRVVKRRQLVSIPLTQQGAVYLDAQRKALRVGAVMSVIESVIDDGRLTTWPLFDDLPTKARTALRLVSLAEPDSDPPPGMVGYFSDGKEHVAVSIFSAVGVRLFFEQEPGDVVRTNVMRYLVASD